MTNDDKKAYWEKSYLNKDNFVFYPHEEIIRFTAKHIVKRTGLHKVNWISNPDVALLDLGCGIGRHVVFAAKLGINVSGIDLSEEAIAVAEKWVAEENLSAKVQLVCSDIRQQPWQDKSFDFIVSHGVLDSMSFEIAKAAVAETARIAKPGALFYCDLVSGDNSEHYPGYSEEEEVNTIHELGTIQSYFNDEKILQLFEPFFEVSECILLRRSNMVNGSYHSRYHLVLTRRQ